MTQTGKRGRRCVFFSVVPTAVLSDVREIKDASEYERHFTLQPTERKGLLAINDGRASITVYALDVEGQDR
jgi:hypothetical protein